MAWAYLYTDVKNMHDKIEDNGERLRAVDEFKHSILPTVGRKSHGSRANNSFGHMLAALKMVDRYWQGVDADEFKTTLTEIIDNLDDDTHQFVKGMDSEVTHYRSLNTIYTRQLQNILDNLRPDQVPITEFFYAIGELK